MDTYDDVLTLQIEPLYPVWEFEPALLDLYNRISKRDMQRLTWNGDDHPTTLSSFLAFMENRKLVFVALDGYHVAGAFWIENIVSELQCLFSGWIPFGYRGEGSERILRQSLDYVHDRLHLPIIYCTTPWMSGHRICERAKMECVSCLRPFHTASKTCTLWTYRSIKNG